VYVLSALSFPGIMVTVLRAANTSKHMVEKPLPRIISAEDEHMPLSAQASGYVDFVMPLDKIPDKLKSLAAALKT